MSNSTKRIGQIKKLAAEVEGLTKNQTFITQGLQSFAQRLSTIEEAVRALVNQFDDGVISETINESRREAVEAQVALTKQAIEASVVRGEMEPRDTVEEDEDIVVVKQFTADGIETFPGYFDSPFGQFVPDLRELVRGEGVGAKISVSDGTSFEILEIYRTIPVEERPAPTLGEELPADVLAELEASDASVESGEEEVTAENTPDANVISADDGENTDEAVTPLPDAEEGTEEGSAIENFFG